MPPEVAEVYKKALGDRNKSARMLQGAGSTADPDQKARLYGTLVEIGKVEQKKEETIEELQRSARKLTNKAKELRDQAKREKNAKRQEELRALADQTEEHRDKVQNKLSQARKS